MHVLYLICVRVTFNNNSRENKKRVYHCRVKNYTKAVFKEKESYIL